MTPAAKHRRTTRRTRDDRGSATAWALGLVVIGLLAAGLVFDGGNAMAAKLEAWHVAQQAARAGADQIDLVLLRTTGTVAIDPPAAEAAARQWLAQAGVDGTVTVTPEQVSVTVTTNTSAVLLAAVGIGSYTVSASGAAEPAT
jgi:Flp pilus assembly protein TadG